MLQSRLAIFLFLAMIGITSLGQTVKRKFIYGVCGHPFTQEAYAGNIDLQIYLIKNVNSKFYRVDIPIDSNGNVSNKQLFLKTIQKLKENGIKILPVLVFDKSVYRVNNNEQYKKGIVFGKNFAAQYKKYFDYYEVGNEVDNEIILGPHVNGTEISHYNVEKTQVVMPYFRGVCEAIHKEDISSKIIINNGWIHYGFFQLLNSYKVPYDIIGCHWYSDMGNIKDVNNNYVDFASVLYKKFKKKYG